MGINIPANSSLGIDFFSIFFVFFFFKANMNLTVFAGILLAVTMATARRASLVRKADEPGEAMREAARPASLVEKIMRAANEADEPDEAKRESIAEKNEIKAKMADEDKKDEADEVDDAKRNKVDLRQKHEDCENEKCKNYLDCKNYCYDEAQRGNHFA